MTSVRPAAFALALLAAFTAPAAPSPLDAGMALERQVQQAGAGASAELLLDAATAFEAAAAWAYCDDPKQPCPAEVRQAREAAFEPWAAATRCFEYLRAAGEWRYAGCHLETLVQQHPEGQQAATANFRLAAMLLDYGCPDDPPAGCILEAHLRRYEPYLERLAGRREVTRLMAGLLDVAREAVASCEARCSAAEVAAVSSLLERLGRSAKWLPESERAGATSELRRDLERIRLQARDAVPGAGRPNQP